MDIADITFSKPSSEGIEFSDAMREFHMFRARNNADFVSTSSDHRPWYMDSSLEPEVNYAPSESSPNMAAPAGPYSYPTSYYAPPPFADMTAT